MVFIYLYLYYKSCVWLCDPTNGSLPGFSVHGVFQARILEQVAISYFRGSPDPGIDTGSPVYLALQMNSLLLSHQRKTFIFYFLINFNKNESENLMNQVWVVMIFIFFFFFFWWKAMSMNLQIRYKSLTELNIVG